MFDRIRAALSAFRTPAPAAIDEDWKHWNRGLKFIRASFEAGLPRDDLWTLADFRDADATLRPEIRRRIRSRGRYERANNPLIDRVVNVWCEDLVGEDGPWLTVSTGNERVNSFIETAWARWWKASNQTGKLQTAVTAESVDGEAVGLIHMNPDLVPLQHPLVAVETDVALIECDRLASPDFENANRQNYIDGVHLHPGTRVPVAYDLLRAHPGTEYLDAITQVFEADTFPAADVLHAFRQRRPEQNRGCCRYVSALPIAGYLRKYLEADVNRQALRAAYAFMLKSTAPGDTGDDEGSNETQWWQQINMPGRQGIGTVLPDGYEPFQFQASGESAELEAFHRIIAGSVSGCYAMPLGRALGEHKNGGYPGMRADMLPYHKTIAGDRARIWEPRYLVPLYRKFFAELRLTRGWQALMAVLADENPAFAEVLLDVLNVCFHWPDKELVVDPSREEESRRKKLAMGLLSREDEVPATNLDDFDTRAAKALGLDVPTYRRLIAKALFNVQSLTEEPENPRNAESAEEES